MTDVLRAKKYSRRERFEKHARFNHTRHRFQPKPADGQHLLIHLAHLRNAIESKRQLTYRSTILRAGMRLVSGTQRAPNCGPDLMLLRGVRSFGNRRAWSIVERQLCDAIAACAVSQVTK